MACRVARVECAFAEASALIAQAARGAGFPLAQSMLFGKAAAGYLAQGGDDTVIAKALADPNDSPVLRLAHLVVDLGRAMAATGTDVALSIDPADSALAPHYAYQAPRRIVSLTIEHRPAPAASVMRVVFAPEAGGVPRPFGRVEIDPALWRHLKALAARMMVPDSATSRNRGAGAQGGSG